MKKKQIRLHSILLLNLLCLLCTLTLGCEKPAPQAGQIEFSGNQSDSDSTMSLSAEASGIVDGSDYVPDENLLRSYIWYDEESIEIVDWITLDDSCRLHIVGQSKCNFSFTVCQFIFHR